MLLKIMAASGGSIAPMRTPLGHLPSSSARESAARPGLNLKAVYQKGCPQDDCDDGDCNEFGRTTTSKSAKPQCHCLQVVGLIDDFRAVAIRVNQHEETLDALLCRAQGQHDGSDEAGVPACGRTIGSLENSSSSRPQESQAKASLPLTLGPLG